MQETTQFKILLYDILLYSLYVLCALLLFPIQNQMLLQ